MYEHLTSVQIYSCSWDEGGLEMCIWTGAELLLDVECLASLKHNLGTKGNSSADDPVVLNI